MKRVIVTGILTAISDVIDDPAFGDYGRLIFPVNGLRSATREEHLLMWEPCRTVFPMPWSFSNRGITLLP